MPRIVATGCGLRARVKMEFGAKNRNINPNVIHNAGLIVIRIFIVMPGRRMQIVPVIVHAILMAFARHI